MAAESKARVEKNRQGRASSGEMLAWKPLPRPSRGFFERHSWVRDALLVPLLIAILGLAYTVRDDGKKRASEAEAHRADEKAQHQAALDALVMEIHANADIARSHEGLIDRNREQNYKDLAVFTMPQPSTRVFDSMGAAGPSNFLIPRDYIAVAGLYTALKFMSDVIQADEEQRGIQANARVCDNGNVRAIEDVLRNKDADVLRISSIVMTMLSGPDYALPAEIVQSPGYYDYWTHQPDAGSLVTTHADSVIVRTGVPLPDGGWLVPSRLVQP